MKMIYLNFQSWVFICENSLPAHGSSAASIPFSFRCSFPHRPWISCRFIAPAHHSIAFNFICAKRNIIIRVHSNELYSTTAMRKGFRSPSLSWRTQSGHSRRHNNVPWMGVGLIIIISTQPPRSIFIQISRRTGAANKTVLRNAEDVIITMFSSTRIQSDRAHMTIKTIQSALYAMWRSAVFLCCSALWFASSHNTNVARLY